MTAVHERNGDLALSHARRRPRLGQAQRWCARSQETVPPVRDERAHRASSVPFALPDRLERSRSRTTSPTRWCRGWALGSRGCSESASGPGTGMPGRLMAALGRPHSPCMTTPFCCCPVSRYRCTCCRRRNRLGAMTRRIDARVSHQGADVVRRGARPAVATGPHRLPHRRWPLT